MNNTLRVRAARTAAALATLTAAAALTLGAAGPAHAITCPAGSVPAIAAGGAEFCSPAGAGGTVGGSGGGDSVPAPVQAYVPPAPAPVTSQPVKGVAPTENPVIDGVPAVVPTAEPAPTETPAAVTPSATTSVTPSAAPSPSATPPAEPIQGTQTSNTMRPAPFIVGVLAVLGVGVAAWYWRRTRKSAADR